MSAQIDELPGAEVGNRGGGGGGGNLLPLILVVVLSTGISLGGGYFLLQSFVGQQDHGTLGGPESGLEEESSGEKKVYEIKELITNLSGPVKTRFLSVDIVAQGVASDFEKIMEENDYRIRHEALKVMGSYDYEEAQSNAFMERVNVDLLKRFASVLQKYSRGDSNVITNLYFTEFVIQ